MTIPLFTVEVSGRRVSVTSTDRSDGDVHPERVDLATLRQRQRAATGAPWKMLDEVHGTAVVDVDDIGPDWLAHRMAGVGDVLVAGPGDHHLAVWTGDCAPLVLISNDGTRVAAHGGWRGIADGVVAVAVAAARRGGGEVVGAVLGPLIHPCCYEFGQDDLDSIADGVAGRTSAGGLALDVPATIAAQLRSLDVDLDVVGPCTGCDERWFSHRVRRDAGRHATVVW